MGDRDFIGLCTTNGSNGGQDKSETYSDDVELHESYSEPCCHEVNEDAFDKENSVQCIDKNKYVDEKNIEGMDVEKNMVEGLPVLQESVEFFKTVSIVDKTDGSQPRGHGKNDFVTAQAKCPVSHEIDDNSIIGVKRARATNDDEQSSLHVRYNSLSRKSKKKLEELLHNWSEWHAHECSSEDPNELLESGEETIFPAMHVGADKSSTVSFLVDNQVRKKQCKDYILLNDESVALYDREYATILTPVSGTSNLEGGLEKLDASRCFNCGSYNHSLKDCPKKRDNAVVNNARKEHLAKKNHRTRPRILTRYYQNSPGGKYDGLKPGVLGTETRQMLGLGELDPPPWLQRMHEMGYPPGYLDSEDGDQPSGITIYADEESRGEQDQENLKADDPKRNKKMTVDFPGINAPIPENADQRKWAALSPGFDSLRNQSGHPRDQMWPGSFPGYSLGVTPPMSSYLPRYGGFEPSYMNDSRPFSDIGRWSPSLYGSPHRSYSFSYPPPYSWQSHHASYPF